MARIGKIKSGKSDRGRSEDTARKGAASSPTSSARAWYRVAMMGSNNELLIALVPLVGDAGVGMRFDADAPSPALVRLTFEREVYCGELEVDVSDTPVEARILWHNDEDDVSDLDMFAVPLRVGRAVMGTGIRYSDDEVRFVVRDIARLG